MPTFFKVRLIKIIRLYLISSLAFQLYSDIACQMFADVSTASPGLCLDAHGENDVNSLNEALDVSDTMVFQDLVSVGLRETQNRCQPMRYWSTYLTKTTNISQEVGNILRKDLFI